MMMAHGVGGRDSNLFATCEPRVWLGPRSAWRDQILADRDMLAPPVT